MSAALEPPAPTLAARIERLAAHGVGRARYTVLGPLAQGGMGRVLRAWDELLSREVAMKVVALRAPLGAGEDERAEHERRLARFIDEARITGQLDHPGIVPVYEIGLDGADGVFFTMPLVRGEDLKRVFARVHGGEDGWTLQRAVLVMHTVCLTVAFAHEKGVVHRDLKPENVMVGPFGEAYVVDWGLAMLLGRSEQATIVGTPAYMAPEQAAARTTHVGPRSDVYSLGAILYELFARRLPHELSLETRAGDEESLESVLSSPPRPLTELRDDVPPELAAICSKAMARDPSARYASAREMADDLEAWLGGRSVSALQSGRWTRLRKWRARNRALAAALDGMAALCVVALGAFALQKRALLREVQAKHELARVAAYSAALSAADLGLRAHEAGDAKRRLAACDPALHGFEWRHLDLRSDASERVLAEHEGPVRAAAVSPGGATIASASDDGDVVLWDAVSGEPRLRLEAHVSVVTSVAFSPDGARLASGSRDKQVLLWDAATGLLERVQATHAHDVVALAFSGDGERLVSGDIAGGLVASSVADGARLAAAEPGSPDSLVALAFVPGSALFAALYVNGGVRLLGPALEVRREVRVLGEKPAGLAADPQGCLVAVATERSVHLYDAATLAQASVLPATSRIRALAFSPCGARLATSGYDSTLGVWDVARGALEREYDGHEDDVNAVAFFPDGERVVTGSEDHTLRLWSLARAPVLSLAGGAELCALAFAPDGRTLATGSRDGELCVLDAASGAELASLSTGGVVDCVALDADGGLYYGCGDGAPRRAPALAPRAGESLPAGPGFPTVLVPEPSSGRLFVRDSAGGVRVLDAARSLVLAELATGDQTRTLALSPRGARLAAGTASGAVLVWDARTLAPLAPLGGESEVTALAFSPDGARLAVARLSRAIELHHVASGRLERTLAGHEGRIACVAFAPDGRRLVSGALDRTVRIWSPDSDEALLALHGHTKAVTAVAFDPAGEVVASASKDGTLRLWRTERALAPPPAPAARADPR